MTAPPENTNLATLAPHRRRLDRIGPNCWAVSGGDGLPFFLLPRRDHFQGDFIEADDVQMGSSSSGRINRAIRRRILSCLACLKSSGSPISCVPRFHDAKMGSRSNQHTQNTSSTFVRSTRNCSKRHSFLFLRTYYYFFFPLPPLPPRLRQSISYNSTEQPN